MKKLIGCLLLALSLSHAVQAQSERTMALGISPLAVIGASLNILYQLKLSDSVALTVPGKFSYDYLTNMIFKSYLKVDDGSVTRTPLSASGGIGIRFLMAGNGLKDTFYLEPRVTLDYYQLGIKGSLVSVEGSTLALTPMVMLGWDWYYNSGFYWGIGGGLGIKYFMPREGNRVSIGNIPALDKDKRKFIERLGDYYLPKESSFGLAADLEIKLGFSW